MLINYAEAHLLRYTYLHQGLFDIYSDEDFFVESNKLPSIKGDNLLGLSILLWWRFTRRFRNLLKNKFSNTILDIRKGTNGVGC